MSNVVGACSQSAPDNKIFNANNGQADRRYGRNGVVRTVAKRCRNKAKHLCPDAEMKSISDKHKHVYIT